MATKTAKVTPLMQQYFQIRADYPDTLLFFQVGDFYELFFQDAVTASKVLNITLTKRGKHESQDVPLCGIPVKALDVYLAKLVKAGFNVAICDQLEEAQAGKVVKRGVTRVLTPGTLIDSNLLDDKSASYLLSFYPLENNQWGLIFGELLTAQLFATKITNSLLKSLESEIAKFFPDEILLPDFKSNNLAKKFNNYFKQMGYITSAVDKLDINLSNNFDNWLNNNFDKKITSKILLDNSIKLAIENFYNYLFKRQSQALDQFKQINFYEPEDFLLLDKSTQKHLELFKNVNNNSRANSLIDIIDKADTPMGSRMLAKWLARPLVDINLIKNRQEIVKLFFDNLNLNLSLRKVLSQIYDLERIVGRIALNRAGLNDYIYLLSALKLIPEIKINLSNINLNNNLFNFIKNNLVDFKSLINLLESSLNLDKSKDWLIKSGYNKNLDKFRDLILSASNKILELEQKEILKTGINSLKIRYHNIQGYFLEVTKPNIHLVPGDYVRLQTLVNRERFTTIELRTLQTEIEQAHNQIGDLEKILFAEIKNKVALEITKLRKLAQALAGLDALLSLANVAYNNAYVCPEFNNQSNIIINSGRHPIIEYDLGANFIPNNTSLKEDNALYVITGPNMGGKSTYLRQVALISILGQIGSFVPAENANLAMLDRIFTRIGAGDNLSLGKSTFLVEMEETAVICKLATSKSLVILDEVGRGTSTFDGLAIAQAVIEYIYSTVKAKCLFATHYHELTKLKEKFSGINNYYAKSKKTDNGIIFLHEIVSGIANGSFGIEVAKLAELPEEIINNSKNILNNLNNNSLAKQNILNSKELKYKDNNLNFITSNKIINLEKKLENANKLLFNFKNLDLNNLSPKRAFDFLWEFKEKM